MANFIIAEITTGRNEGGYANNPADRGGETYAGIARNFWPNWAGWKFIDKYKADYAQVKTKLSLAKWINASAKVESEPVEYLVSDFYKKQFWDKLQLDLVVDQQLANSIYDFGVNSGTVRAAKFIQEVVGTTADGIIGFKTILAINEMNPSVALMHYNFKREFFYRSIATGNQAQFLKSWLSRLKPYK